MKYATQSHRLWWPLAFALVYFWLVELDAQTAYVARSGKISFNVGTNVPFIEVAGTSNAISGGGEATVEGSTATVRHLHFEVEPATLKTGNALRDRHMNERVFTAADGSLPSVLLKAEIFRAKAEPQRDQWGAELQAQLTLRGVTRPVLFHVTGERRGDGAIVRAEGVVRTSEFGVKPISNTGVTVKDEVHVMISDLLLQPERSTR